jgi:hypothetical protein
MAVTISKVEGTQPVGAGTTSTTISGLVLADVLTARDAEIGARPATQLNVVYGLELDAVDTPTYICIVQENQI